MKVLLGLIVGAVATGENLPAKPSKDRVPPAAAAIVWRDPGDLTNANLIYGSGGESHQPNGPFQFVEEDMDGTNPKFDVKDADGVKWKVKMGAEVKPEIAASRLLWAAGYFTNEDYFLPEIKVKDLPHLHRGQNFVQKDGTIRNVRLKRSAKGQEKAGIWEWGSNPFTGTRELNGLRTLMAVINNWDLKDVNNAVYNTKRQDDEADVQQIYVVTDLGASFGTNGYTMGLDSSRGNLENYKKSKFITKSNSKEVDFATPGRPTLVETFNLPTFMRRVDLRSIGRDIPRADAKWLGERLGQLTPQQIQDAFLAAGYTPAEATDFASVVQSRISELNAL